MLPMPNLSQYSPSLRGTYQHLFVCHRPRPTDFQHPPPRPHFKCFQQLLLPLFHIHVSAANSATFRNVLFIICVFCLRFNFPAWHFLMTCQNISHIPWHCATKSSYDVSELVHSTSVARYWLTQMASSSMHQCHVFKTNNLCLSFLTI